MDTQCCSNVIVSVDTQCCTNGTVFGGYIVLSKWNRVQCICSAVEVEPCLVDMQCYTCGTDFGGYAVLLK